MRTRVKICGVRDIEAAYWAAEAGADAVGFIFVPGSPRFIEPEEAAGIMLALPPLLTAVAVVRDLSVDEFCELEQSCPTTLTQLHGKETEDTVRACGPGVIKAFSYDGATIGSQLRKWGQVDEVDAVLIDSGAGGSGQPLPWAELGEQLERAREAGLDRPVFLAGGLTPENVAEAVRLVRPYAVDVSSGVESSPGVKDEGKIWAFCEAVRAADAAG